MVGFVCGVCCWSVENGEGSGSGLSAVEGSWGFVSLLVAGTVLAVRALVPLLKA